MFLIQEFVKKKIINTNEALSIEDEIFSTGKNLDSILLSMDIDPNIIFNIKKEFFIDIPVFTCEDVVNVSKEILNYIPKESAQKHYFVPIKIENNELMIGMVDPSDLTAKTVLQFIASKFQISYKIYLISQGCYEHILSNYSGIRKEVFSALGDYSIEKKKEKEKKSDILDDIDVIRVDSPIAKIISNIVKGAVQEKASDIHIEINEKDVPIRYRIDGILEKKLMLPKNTHHAIVARIKILSNIKIDEKRKPQDGRFSGIYFNKKIDFRVSIFPTYYGEKVVIRLLEKGKSVLSLSGLGLNYENIIKIKKALSHTYGIILVCGPTGSGKTSTLYSLLNEIDRKQKNVVSLEDPIELNIDGVSQSQIHPSIGYTFASGLRSILRQDPDIIMVGEIRDQETAVLAIQAALTGHLVFSTIHTNTASDIPQRLIDMGVEPYLIGPTLIISIGQRLIRKIDKDVRVEKPIALDIKKFIEDEINDLPKKIQDRFKGEKMYIAEGMKENETGMSGRIGVFEVMEITDEMRRLIVTNPSSLSIYRLARKNDFVTFKEDGILKALDGVTSFSEVMSL